MTPFCLANNLADNVFDLRLLPCGTKFLRIPIFAISAVFPAIRKNKFPQIKIIAHIFPAKIYFRVNIL